MRPSHLLIDCFDRVQSLVAGVVDELTPEELAHRVDAGANSIGWLVWHLTRIEDDHIAAAAEALGRSSGTDQVWLTDGYVRRFDLPFADTATGYGQRSADAGKVAGLPASLLREYYDAVHARTVDFLVSLSDDDYDVVVDEHWDPPVTLGVRLVSVVGDTTQHVGQAAFVRGIIERSR
jgi:uncharacterized damage-inducible protein DinB